VTEEQTKALERDARKWSREYAAVPAEAHDEALFDVSLVDAAQRAEPGDVPPSLCAGQVVGAMDPSLARHGGNAFTFVLAAQRALEDRNVASIILAREYRAARGGELDLGAILSSIAGHCSAYGCTSVVTDQYHGESLASLAGAMHLPIEVLVDKPTSAERLRRYESTLVRMINREIEIPRNPIFRADLLAVRRRVTKGSDGWTIHMAVSGDGRHADFAPAAVLALDRVAVDEALPGWVHAMERYQAANAPSTPEQPSIAISYRDLPSGEVEVTGTEKGRAIGRAWFPKGNASRVTWELGSPDRFREAAWAEFQKRRLLSPGRDETR
jgi:hypothetical protein